MEQGSSTAGVDSEVLWAVAGKESNFGKNTAKNPLGSARGPFGFTDGTWQKLAVSMPSLNLTDSSDPYQQARAAPYLLKSNNQVLRNALGRDPTPTEQYIGWNAGVGAAPRLITSPADTPLSTLFSPAAMRQNPIFGKLGNAGNYRAWAAKGMSGGGSEDVLKKSGDPVPETDPGNVTFATAVPNERATENQKLYLADAQREGQWSTSTAAWEAAKNENMVGWMMDMGRVPRPDPNYNPTEAGLKADQRLTGIGVEHYGYLMGSRSDAEMDQRVASLKSDMEYEKKMGELGLTGAGLRMGASLLDPAGWLVSAASPISGGAIKLGRVGHILAAGVEGAVGGLAADVPAMVMKPTYDRDRFMYTAAGGLAFGLGVGALIKPHPELQGDIDGIIKSSAAITSQIDSAYAPGSVGAARNLGHVEGVRGDTSDFIGTDFINRETGNTAFEKARLDLSGRMTKSDNPLTAALGSRLVEDAVGKKDYSAVNRAVSVEAGLIQQRQSTFLMKEYQSAWTEYKTRNNIGWNDGDAQRTFREAISDVIDNTDPTLIRTADPAVIKAAAANSEFFERYHKLITDPGSLDGSTMAPLKGVAELESNPEYFPRIWDFMKFGEGARAHGDVQMKSLVRESILSANPGIELADATRMASGFYKGLRNVQAGQEVSISRMVSGDDREGLRGFLRENSDMSEEDLTRIIAKMTPDQETGNTARTKQRSTMNVHHEMPLKDTVTGETSNVSLKSFLERDSLMVSEMYSRQMSAQVALARLRIENPKWKPGLPEGDDTARWLVDGIRGDGDWDKLTKQISAVGDELGHKTEDTAADLKRLQFTYDHITGKAGRDETGKMGTAIRILKDYNFMRVMNQVGFSQAAETWNLVATVGIKAAMSQMPTFRAVMRDARTGRLNDDVMEQLEHMSTPGTDMLRGLAHLPVDDFGHVVRDSKLEAVEGLLKKGTRLTSMISGMAPITTYQQKWMAKAALARFAMDATGEKALNVKRLATLGIDPKMAAKIKDNLQRHEGYVQGESGTNLRVLQLEKWDPDARHALEYGIHTWTRKAIQENDLGQMNTVIGTTMGKLMFQFRMFMFGAYTKQTLHGLHMRDWESASMVLGSSIFGGLTYAARTYLGSVGRSDRDEYLSKRLSPKSLGAAAIQSGGWSSILPMAADAGTYMMGFDPMFDSRVTGTPSQGLTSNPSMDLLNNAMNVSKGLSGTAFRGEQYSQKDLTALRTILPFGNFIPVVMLSNGMMRGLQKGDTHRHSD